MIAVVSWNQLLKKCITLGHTNKTRRQYYHSEVPCDFFQHQELNLNKNRNIATCQPVFVTVLPHVYSFSISMPLLTCRHHFVLEDCIIAFLTFKSSLWEFIKIGYILSFGNPNGYDFDINGVSLYVTCISGILMFQRSKFIDQTIQKIIGYFAANSLCRYYHSPKSNIARKMSEFGFSFWSTFSCIRTKRESLLYEDL